MKALMRNILWTGLFVTIIILLSPMRSFSADVVKLKYVTSVYSDDKGKAIKQPEGAACNENFLLVADTGNNRLLRYEFQEGGLKKEPVEINIPQLSYPVRVKVNSRGEIYVLDGRQHRIISLGPDGDFRGYLEPKGVPLPSAYVPRSFDIDEKGSIYILDIFSERILVLDPDWKYTRQVKFPGDYGFFSDVSVNFKGSILILDSVNALVFSAPKDSAAFSPLTEGLRGYVRFPISLTTDKRGHIYVVDQNGSNIIILGQDGSFLGQPLNMGWKESLLNYPSQICINDKGDVFIADTSNNRVQMFSTQ